MNLALLGGGGPGEMQRVNGLQEMSAKDAGMRAELRMSEL